MKGLELFDYLAQLDDIHGSRLEDGLQLTALWIRRNFVEVERLFSVFHPFFTLHDHKHSDAVVNHLHEIATRALLVSHPPSSDERALSRHETFYLLSAAYLHDIGMIVCLPGDTQQAESEGKTLSEIIRRDHHERSAQVVEMQKDVFLLTPHDVDIIATLCRGHRITSLDGPKYDVRYDERNRPIRVRLLAGLLRMADELDLVSTRAPDRQRLILESGGQLDPIARRHWMKHYYTESISFSVEEQGGALRAIKINTRLLVPDEIHARHMRQELTQRIEQHLKSVSFNEYGFNLTLGEMRDTLRPDLNLASSVLRKQDVRILYADDDPYYLAEVGSALKKRGFVHCDAVPDSASTLNKLAQVTERRDRQYHQIILDLKMPDLNGIASSRAGVDLIPVARKLCPNAQLTVFTSSSSEDEAGRVAVKEAAKLGAKVIYKDRGLGLGSLAHAIEDALAQSYIIVGSDPTTKEGYPMSEKLYVPEKYCVLIVDDDPLWADACAEALRREHIDVDRVGGAEEAAAKLKKKHYHAAILDKNMPDLKGRQSDHAGIDLLEYIRENYPDMSCLILTAEATAATYKEAMKLGMFDYRDKDQVGPEAIAGIVSEMFRTRLVMARTLSGHPIEADRMYFYGKTGVVVKKVTTDTGEDAGGVKIDDETWTATTKGTVQAVTISVGTEIHAREIEYGAILVTSGMY